jgi:signal transduction histidine kinase
VPPRRGALLPSTGTAYSHRGRQNPTVHLPNDLVPVLLDDVPQFFGLLAADGVVREISRHACIRSGFAADVLRGRPLVEAPWWQDPPAARARVAAALQAREAACFDAGILTADGTPLRLAWRLRPLSSPLEGLLFVAEQTEETAQPAAVGRLAGGIAHDFNNLLQAMAGNLELARASLGSDPERCRRLLGNALRAVGRAGHLISQLLAFSGRQMLHRECCRPAELVRELAGTLSARVGAAVRLVVTTAPRPWSCRLDRTQFAAALTALVANADEAMAAGGAVHIGVANRGLRAGAAAALGLAPGSYVEVAVRDEGCGMRPEVLARAFEPFFTTKRIGEGSGLGLSQVQGFARQSGGAVMLRSQPGGGTLVALFFPRAAEGCPEEEA